MNLPHCFLADLPPEAELTPALIFEAWLSLQRNHEQHLAGMRTSAILRDISNAAELWLEKGSPFMQHAVEAGSRDAGFPEETLTQGLTNLFESLNIPALEAWVEQDLGHINRLDDFCATGAERANRRRSKATGFNTLAHVAAGNVPPAPVMSMVAGLVVRSAQIIRCSAGATLIPLLFAHSLREVNSHLSACLEVASWPHERLDLQQALFESAECITATGSDETIGSIRDSLPATKRFVPYGHKVSFAYIADDALVPDQLDALVEAVTADICAWNQLGCLSPHVIYVEEGGSVRGGLFAARLAEELDAMEKKQPRGNIGQHEAASIRSRRSFFEVRAANLKETSLWHSKDSTAWTVVHDGDPQFQASCLNRFIYVKSVGNLEAVLEGADAMRGKVSTVGVAGSSARLSAIAERLAAWGVSRICRVGRMQSPPAPWRHDGRPALNELVRWTDWEE